MNLARVFQLSFLAKTASASNERPALRAGLSNGKKAPGQSLGSKANCEGLLRKCEDGSCVKWFGEKCPGEVCLLFTERECNDGSCVPINESCPCDEDEVRCHGECIPADDVCCAPFFEELCEETQTCAKKLDGGCPCPEGQEKCIIWGSVGYCIPTGTECYQEEESFGTEDAAMLIRSRGTPNEVSHLNSIEKGLKKLSTQVNHAELAAAAQKEILAMALAIKKKAITEMERSMWEEDASYKEESFLM